MASAQRAAVVDEPLYDGSLIEAMARGDRGAFASLYDRHAPILLALGLNMLGDRATAEAVLEDVFLDAWHGAPEIGPGRCSVRAWLLGRMRQRALERRRPGTPVSARSGGLSPLAGLAPDLAAVIELAYYEGMPCHQIATRLQTTLPAVRSLLARAVQALREVRPTTAGES